MKKSESRPSVAAKHVYQLKIKLPGSVPLIWRRVLVPSSLTMSKLHRVFQITMGWRDCHLHRFLIDGVYYSAPVPDTDWEDVGETDYRRLRLSQLVPASRLTFLYEYDFGDGWVHEILVEKILEKEPGKHYPVCLEGKRACPPEDVGGLGGYGHFLNVMRNPNHLEYAFLSGWIGGAFDPAAFDLEAVNVALASIRL
jgi:hypothetical protein